jgi:hypothetical protein
LRVFPVRTAATPEDEFVRIGVGPTLADRDIADEVHVSVAFSWLLDRGVTLQKVWSRVAPTLLGGPAVTLLPGEFVSGLYMKPGFTITSRGCNNRCAWCFAWRNEGPLRELPIVSGNIVQDNNLLACSRPHVEAVFRMVSRHQYVKFTGGFEAALFQPWHAEALAKLHLESVFFAYDDPSDHSALVEAGKLLKSVGITNQKARCYVLCGQKNDTFEAAEQRMMQAIHAGFMPCAMVFQDNKGKKQSDWDKWQRLWSRTQIIASRFPNEINAHRR